MSKYEELNDAKDNRLFHSPLISLKNHQNWLTDAVDCLANDRFTQGTDRQRK